ncbi:unnamed protein product [Peronospora belbahrii]|uniref:Uncharacterized protein n=1 Tax=Peronospora belbahrii TaxID=622444 RepID=A0AAU9L990_9STRA|nr:unnamed protein product [Peronospora belbahrii]
MAATRNKPSVFTALNQLHVTNYLDSDDGSAEERQQERKEKQKQKKKTRSKKKNSESVQLKTLAFVSVSKPKKSKSKKSKILPQSPTGLPDTELSLSIKDDDNKDKKKVEELKPLLEKNILNETLQKTCDVRNDIDKKSQSVPQQQKMNPVSKKQQKKKAASPPQQQPQPPQQVTIPPSNGTSPPVSTPLSQSETELGAIYTPAHITITREDGQVKRTVAVTEVMDQLLRCTQQNSQLLMMQEQLGHANRSLQDQLQRSSEIINGLQNEVTMFRQMCLNLQAEVSLLRSHAVSDVGNNHQSLQHRPPPGMS